MPLFLITAQNVNNRRGTEVATALTEAHYGEKAPDGLKQVVGISSASARTTIRRMNYRGLHHYEEARRCRRHA